jgi:quinol monooxygenase YgiN
MKIYLTALLKCKPGTTAQMKSYLEALVAASNKEEACEQYELYQSTGDDDTQFIFHETWASQQGLDLHGQQPHITLFKQQIADVIDGPLVIYKTERVA